MFTCFVDGFYIAIRAAISFIAFQMKKKKKNSEKMKLVQFEVVSVLWVTHLFNAPAE